MLSVPQVERAFIAACRLDVQAFKPGNVSVHSEGHGMSPSDFVTSARCAAPFIARRDLSVGARILGAIEATHAAVHCNTNLGIVLLCAPLAHALGATLARTLEELSIADAGAAFVAIRLAAPGGLGDAPEHDVRRAPRVTLLEAMRAAAHRDRIAYQYVSEFSDVFSLGVPTARRLLARGWSAPWAMTGVFLRFLSAFPDSHVERKFGPRLARSLTRDANVFLGTLERARRPERTLNMLLRWDRTLKNAGINPGTSADLAVATWFALRLEDALKKG